MAPPVNKTSTCMGSHWATQKNAIYGEIQSSASLESSWSPLHAEKTTWQRPKDLGTVPLRPHIFLKPLLRFGTLTKRGSQHHVGGCNMMQYVHICSTWINGLILHTRGHLLITLVLEL